jgi:hypothetical protein
MLERFMELKEEILHVGATLFIPAVQSNIPTNAAMN